MDGCVVLLFLPSADKSLSGVTKPLLTDVVYSGLIMNCLHQTPALDTSGTVLKLYFVVFIPLNSPECRTSPSLVSKYSLCLVVKYRSQVFDYTTFVILLYTEVQVLCYMCNQH